MDEPVDSTILVMSLRGSILPPKQSPRNRGLLRTLALVRKCQRSVLETTFEPLIYCVCLFNQPMLSRITHKFHPAVQSKFLG